MKNTPPRAARDLEPVVLDVEMFGQDPARLHRPHGTLACLSIAYKGGETYQVYTIKDVRESVRQLRKGLWVMHNAAYDLRQLRQFVDLPQVKVWDTMIVERDLWGGWYDSFALSDLVRRYLGELMEKDTREEFGSATEMTDEMKMYSINDAIKTMAVMEAQQSAIVDNELEMRHYWEVDEPALHAFLDLQPVKVDVDGWLKLAEKNAAIGKKLEEELGLNSKSAVKVKEAIEKLTGAKLKGTNAKDVLEPLVFELRLKGKGNEAAMVEKVLEARRYRDAASKYGVKWVEEYVEPGGLVYADWGVTVAETGRSACRSPNLQNIPVRKMPEFRKLFISQFGKKGRMLVADYNQQEPRVMAWYSKDKNLRDALLAGRDLHQETADDFHLSRREGKDINLGLGYGMSPEGLASRARVSIEVAEDGIRKRNARYPQAAMWMAKQRMQGQSIGYVTTSMGRRIWLDTYGKQWERNAINGPIQGTAAEQTKTWVWLVNQRAEAAGLPLRLCLVVHDEVVGDVMSSESRAYTKLIREAGLDAGKIVVPGMPMEIGITAGTDWGVKE